MPEIPKNIPSPDISDVLSTYKSHPTAEDDAAPKGLIVQKEPVCTNKNSPKEVWSMPKCETPFEKKMYILHEGLRMFEVVVNASVKIAKVGAWCIAIFGSLFVALLATNKMDQATEMFNKNILSKWGKSTEITAENGTKTPGAATGLKSSALNTPTETPEMIAKKRAALIEARKVARLQQEKLKAAEKDLTQ